MNNAENFAQTIPNFTPPLTSRPRQNSPLPASKTIFNLLSVVRFLLSTIYLSPPSDNRTQGKANFAQIPFIESFFIILTLLRARLRLKKNEKFTSRDFFPRFASFAFFTSPPCFLADFDLINSQDLWEFVFKAAPRDVKEWKFLIRFCMPWARCLSLTLRWCKLWKY